MAQAAEAVSFLYRAGAARVWLFGSSARGELRDSQSDLDIAVEGLSGIQVEYCTTVIRQRLSCKVDVVDLNRVAPFLRNTILERRVLVSFATHDVESLASTLPARQVNLRDAPRNLNEIRLQTVVDTLRAHRARTILDLGCGTGALLGKLAAEPTLERALGVDISSSVLERARKRLELMPQSSVKNRIGFLQALATNPDKRFRAFSAVTAVELIEHLDEARLASFAQVVFGYVQPDVVIITTPNAEYNIRWGSVAKLRHPDHRFEWTRRQFQDWVLQFTRRYRYTTEFGEIGMPLVQTGGPTQIATCARLAAGKPGQPRATPNEGPSPYRTT